MPGTCCVHDCQNLGGFRFPKDQSRRQQWITIKMQEALKVINYLAIKFQILISSDSWQLEFLKLTQPVNASH